MKKRIIGLMLAAFSAATMLAAVAATPTITIIGGKEALKNIKKNGQFRIAVRNADEVALYQKGKKIEDAKFTLKKATPGAKLYTVDLSDANLKKGNYEIQAKDTSTKTRSASNVSKEMITVK